MCHHWVFRYLNGARCTPLYFKFDSIIWTVIMSVSCLCMIYTVETINMLAMRWNTCRPREQTEPDLGGGVRLRMCPWKCLLIICIWLMQIALFAAFPCRWGSSTFIVGIIEGQMAVRQWGEHHSTNKTCQFLHSFYVKTSSVLPNDSFPRTHLSCLGHWMCSGNFSRQEISPQSLSSFYYRCQV